MDAILFPVAVALMIGGAASAYFGAPIITTERGWAMVISGSVAGSGGAVLLGLAVAGVRLKRVERAILAATAPAVPPEAERGQQAAGTGAPGAAPPRSLPDPIAAVVGRYNAGVNSYDMYADGSIRAVTPDGEHRFGSLEEFRAFFADRAGQPVSGRPPGAQAGSGAEALPTAARAKA